MKLDDRNMTIMTALVLMVAVGAILGRGENGESIITTKPEFKPAPDTFSLRAGRVQLLDVMLNDTGADLVDPQQLRVLAGPTCGMAEALDGAIQFSESETCIGEYELSYCVPFEDDCERTIVSLKVLNVERERQLAEAQRQRQAEQGSLGEVSQLAMQAPVRLEMPDTAEVITPGEATESIRNRNQTVSVSVSTDVAGLTSSGVNVANDSARVRSVATGGVTLSSPLPDAGASGVSGVNIASASRPSTGASPSAPTSRPGTPAPLQTAGVSLPGRPAQPGGLQSPSGFDQNALPSGLGGGQPLQIPQIGTQTAAVEDVTDDNDVPDPVEPVETASVAPTVGEAPSAPEVASIARDTAGPAAQTQEPTVARVESVPENSGVLASIARSSSVLGVTVSAARALLSPSEVDSGAGGVNADTRSAPRPGGVGITETLSGQDLTIAELGGAGTSLPRVGSDPVRSPLGAPSLVAALQTESRIDIQTAPAAPPPPRDVVVVAPEPETVQPQAGEDVAALTTGTTESTPTPPQPVQIVEDCGIEMGLTAQFGAEIVASISSPCRPNRAFMVEHSGIAFTISTDESGLADFTVPALRRDAEVTVTFNDGSVKTDSVTVDGLENLIRVAVMWSSDIDFDLHAYEFGARENTEGHIWSQNPGSYRSARRNGTGYLTVLGRQTGLGWKTEVYTLIQNSRTQGGLIDLSLELAAFGAICESAPVIRTMRIEGEYVERDSDIQFDLSSCGSAEEVLIPNTIQDIRVARR